MSTENKTRTTDAINAPESTGDEGFLSRWSKRKLQPQEPRLQENGLQESGLQENELQEIEEIQATVEPHISEESPAEPIVHKTDADMPSIESLNEDSNVKDFFSPEVSEKLRRLALRKLFHMPKFNITDGLNDYDEDYTTFEPLGDIVTADMKFHREREAEKLRAEAEALGEDVGSSLADGEDDDELIEASEDLAPNEDTEDDSRVAGSLTDDSLINSPTEPSPASSIDRLNNNDPDTKGSA